MVIFLYGLDSYRRQKKIKELVADYRRKYSAFDLRSFDFSIQNGDKQEEFIKLKEFISTPSLFVSKKLGVLENAFFKISAYSTIQRKELKEFFKAQLSLRDLVLIISDDSKPPAGFEFLINAETPSPELKFQEFNRLEGGQLRHFIKKEAEERGVNLDIGAVNFLAESFNGDNLGLVNELGKLSLIKAHTVDVDKIKEVSDYIFAPNEWRNTYCSIMGVIGNQSLSRKIRNLEILFSHQEEPAKIFNILASQVQEIKLAQKMADYDPLIKFGRLDYEEALLDLVISHQPLATRA